MTFSELLGSLSQRALLFGPYVPAKSYDEAYALQEGWPIQTVVHIASVPVNFTSDRIPGVRQVNLSTAAGVHHLKRCVSSDSPFLVVFHIQGPLAMVIEQQRFGDPSLASEFVKLASLLSQALLDNFRAPLLVVFDEPYLSYLSEQTEIKLSTALFLINTVVDALQQPRLFLGLRCGPVPWTWVLTHMSVEVLFINVHEHATSLYQHTVALQSFAQTGGCIVWGIVPTRESLLSVVNQVSLRSYLSGLWLQLQAHSLLAQQALYSPAGEFTGCSSKDAAAAHDFLHSFSRRMNVRVLP